jgi:hypothetical protein
VGWVTRPLEAGTFGSMQACRTRMAWTCLARRRTLRFRSALIVCISLLMVLAPSAQGFAMTTHGTTAPGTTTHGKTALGNTAQGNTAQGNTAHGNTAHGKAARGNTAYGVVAGADGDETLNAPPSDDKSTVLATSYPHGDLCCIGGTNPSEDTGSSHDTCASACCSGLMIACRHHVGVLVPAETAPLLPIPTSASRGAIHPPPRSDRMT